MESAAEAFKDRQFKSHQVSIECLVEQVGDNNNRRGLGEDPRGGNKSNNNRRNNNTSSSSFDASDNRTPQERLNDQVTPLWRKTYTEQLVEKTRTVKKTLKKFTRMLQDTVKGQSADKKAALDWLGPAERNGFFGLCEPAVVGSPRETGYRSKCEFSFGRNAAGEKTLGFLLGLFKDGITSVLVK